MPRVKSAYQHLVSGEAFGIPHEAGDPVDPSHPAEKVQEWLAAGIVKRVRKEVHGNSASTPQ